MSSSNSVNAAPRTSPWVGFMRDRYDWMLAFCIIGLLPLMIVQTNHLASRKHLQFFPLAWIFFAAIVYLRGQPSGQVSVVRKWFSGMLLAAAVLAATFAVLRFSPWLGHLTLLAVVLSWLLVRLENSWTELLMWVSVAAITLPLPMNWDTLFIQRLQTLSTASASYLLDLTQTPHVTRGNVLEIRTGELFVDEACSGVDSLYALGAIALMLVIVQKRSFLSSALTLALVPCWAWLGNLIRIFLIAFCLDRYGTDLSHGWQHTALGLGVFGLSFLSLLLTQNAINGLLEPFPVDTVNSDYFHRWFGQIVSWPKPSPLDDVRPPRKEGAVVTAESGRRQSKWGLGIAVALCTSFLFLGAASCFAMMGLGSWKPASILLPTWPDEVVNQTFSAEDLPADVSGFRRQKFEVSHRDTGSIFGGHSASWIYLNGEQPLQVSADFPFTGFHGLEACYVLSGRETLGPVEATQVQEDGFLARIMEVTMSDELKQVSYLCYLNYDINGNPVTPFKSALLGGALASPPVAYQVQVFVPECGQLTDQQRAKYQEFLVRSARLLLPKIQQLPGARS